MAIVSISNQRSGPCPLYFASSRNRWTMHVGVQSLAYAVHLYRLFISKDSLKTYGVHLQASNAAPSEILNSSMSLLCAQIWIDKYSFSENISLSTSKSYRDRLEHVVSETTIPKLLCTMRVYSCNMYPMKMVSMIFFITLSKYCTRMFFLFVYSRHDSMRRN